MSEAAFRRLLEDSDADEFDAALAVAGLLSTEVDTGTAEAALTELVHAFDALAEPTPIDLCRFMADRGFSGAVDDYFGLGNSCIDQVLERRRGIPITLAVIYLRVARGAGLDAWGINFPGHFLISVADQLVDPYRARLTDRSACEQSLSEAGFAAPFEPAFRRASHLDIALRMLNNARAVMSAGGQWVDALEVLDHQLLLAPDEPQLYVDQAQLWVNAGSPAMARDVLLRARDRFANTPAQQEIAERLANLPGSDSDTVLH